VQVLLHFGIFGLERVQRLGTPGLLERLVIAVGLLPLQRGGFFSVRSGSRGLHIFKSQCPIH
jgi:hypothetical protein